VSDWQWLITWSARASKAEASACRSKFGACSSESRETGRIRRSRTQSEFFFSTIWPKIAISRIERRKRYVSQSRTAAGPSRSNLKQLGLHNGASHQLSSWSLKCNPSDSSLLPLNSLRDSKRSLGTGLGEDCSQHRIRISQATPSVDTSSRSLPWATKGEDGGLRRDQATIEVHEPRLSLDLASTTLQSLYPLWAWWETTK